MKSKKLEELLTQNLQYFIKHWKNTSHQGELDNKLILSVSDGYERAKVITPIISHNDILEEGGKAVLKLLLNKLEWAASKFDNPLKWLRLEWINKERKFTWKEFNKDLRGYKRNYYRSGIAYKGNTKPWCLLTEMELNANACLYMGGEVPYAKVNYKNLNKYIKSRHSSNNIPSFDSEMELIVFQTSGMFFDAQMNDVEILCTLPRRHGSREISSLTPKITSDLIDKTTLYLANQVKPSGRFEYGHFPCFGRNINTYNTLRHASSVYSLIEGYSFCREHQLETQNLRFIAQQIELALTYLEENVIKHYSDDKSYVLEINNTIKLGANAVCILALVKYMQVFKESEHNSRFLKLSRNLANGILAMQKASGQFVHVLNADTLEVISENHVIYYDGEAVFGLMRLYGIDKDERLIDCVERAFDYFIESEAGHNGAHDHWLSYCTNEMVIYRPERKYFQFAVNNVKGFTDFIKNRITTYPTLLELSMAFHKMLLKLDEYPEHKSVLEGFDVKDFYEALHARANYLVNGFFFPEMAMFYKKPDTILNGCFIRHHAFRVRIDDVQHYLSGWVAYHSLLSGQSYPKSVNQTNRKLIEGDQVLTPLALEEATGGRWLIRPKKGWTATGLCIHPGGFKKGCLLVARGKNMEKGYLPKVAVKSFTLKGAGAIVTDDYEEYVDFGVPVLLVPNVRKATIDIGKWSRKYFRGDVIGVTGSAGKTTTVAMLSHALQMQVEIDQTKGSANLPIGIAWNMASMSQTAKTWVLELSIGNMALNTQLAQPNIAIVTNIAAAHLEYHNTLDMVAIKKSRIFEAMNPNELAIICRDIEQYELISEKAKEHGLTIISYGEHEKSDIRLIDYAPNIAKISLRGKIHMLEMSSIGKHMVLNAMAVLGVADHKSLDISKVINQLNSFSAIEGRGEAGKSDESKVKYFTIDQNQVGKSFTIKAEGDSKGVGKRSDPMTITYVLKNLTTGQEWTKTTDKVADAVLEDVLQSLPAGEYELTVTPTDKGGIYKLNVGVEVVHLTEYKTGHIDPITGSLFENDQGKLLVDTLTIAHKQVSVNDPNKGAASITIEGQYGTLVVKKDGSYTYTPKGGVYGIDKFIYETTSKVGTKETAVLEINVGKNVVASQYDDIATSSTANDTFTMGAGADTVIFTNLADDRGGNGGNGLNKWTDFNAEEGDKIDLTQLLNGKQTADNITDYLKYEDGVLSVDRNGKGEFEQLLEVEAEDLGSLLDAINWEVQAIVGSRSLDLSNVESFEQDDVDTPEVFSLTLEDVVSTEENEEITFFLDSEESEQVLPVASTDNVAVESAALDVQPVVDPLDDLLEQNTTLI
ncbi:Mur ligase family protein [Thiopseudomonas alkaliphila]|uniref:Mur ligase family protein n=1 Tax=Thiopseudomonas alkaliphila TaxID=1697053 RepID=UPI00069EA1A4|nr:Mur ligase family protein [Thiopseudomonas alkaliphila]